MKTDTTLRQLSRRHNATLARIATEILCAAGLERRIYPALIRQQEIPAELVAKAKAYRHRKLRQVVSGYRESA